MGRGGVVIEREVVKVWLFEGTQGRGFAHSGVGVGAFDKRFRLGRGEAGLAAVAVVESKVGKRSNWGSGTAAWRRL